MASRIERFRTALADRLPVGANVLDFGCGSGDITCALAAAGWRLTGCDVSAAMLERARAQGADAARWVRLNGGTDATLPFGDAEFDGVVASSVFEYLCDPAAVVRELARVLKPGGPFLLTVPDPRHPVRRTEARKARLAEWAPMRRLIGRTRWADEFTYLRLSINRWPPEAWIRLLNDADFSAEAPATCTDPLLLLAAIRAAPSRPSTRAGPSDPS